MNILSKILNRFTMYEVILWELRALIAVSIILSFFGVISYNWWHILLSTALFIGASFISNQLLARIFKVKTNYESQYITGEILALIVGPLNPLTEWPAILLISFLAMAGKYLLVYGKRHIFNPAALAVLASAVLIGQSASWWAGNRYLLPVVIIGTLFTVQKLRWWHLTLSFLFTYLAALTSALLYQGADNQTIFAALQSSILDSALIFFAGVMLVEPLTAPQGKNFRIAYGVVIALLMVGLPLVFPSFGYSIEASLIIGNLLFFLSGKKMERQTLKLTNRAQESSDTVSFMFEPLRKFDFIPGQFMEWTLPHDRHDSRGIRRFFTIASSPAENHITLVSKFYPNPSTYKQALAKLKPGDEIIASHLDGEFVLPKDERQKLLFIAGGVGITPFISMVKHLLDQKLKRDIVLLFANKTAKDVIYQDLWQSAKTAGVKTIHILSEENGAGWTGYKGFVNADLITKTIPDFKDRMAYVSGPEPMVISLGKMLKGMGLPDSKIKRDYFPGYQL